jgi:hypothetical protein
MLGSGTMLRIRAIGYTDEQEKSGSNGADVCQCSIMILWSRCIDDARIFFADQRIALTCRIF